LTGTWTYRPLAHPVYYACLVSETLFPAYPASRVEAARTALSQQHRRATRAATRAGQAAPTTPELTITREYVQSRCACGRAWEGLGPCGSIAAGSSPAHHHVKRHELVDLELRADAPGIAGWDFLAVIEPLEGGNLLRQVPGAIVAEGELLPWRQGALHCDHCRSARHRRETFILRADHAIGPDAPPAYKQVGRNCLCHFLGGISADSIIARLGWRLLVVHAAGDEWDGTGGCGGRAMETHDPEEFLAWCVSIARNDGFITRAQAKQREVASTSELVLRLLGNPPGDPQARAKWMADRERLFPTDEDGVRGGATLAWARGLPGHNDYARNLQLVASQRLVKHDHAGILASAVQAYARELGEEVRRRAVAAVGSTVGAVGDRLELELTVERKIPSLYNSTTIVSLRDAQGRAFMWRTGALVGAEGDRLRLTGTIKRHSEFRGEPQTELTRCRVSHRHPAGRAEGYTVGEARAERRDAAREEAAAATRLDEEYAGDQVEGP